MRKYISTLILLTTIGVLSALYYPVQGGTGSSVIPSLGQVLVGNGTYYVPQATSTLGFMDFTYASSTFVTYAYGSSSYSGISNAYASTTFPSFDYASSTYYFATNPSGYITSASLSPYVPFTYASTTFVNFTYATNTFATIASLSSYYLASNPSAYISLGSLSASKPLNYNSGTGAFTTDFSTSSVNSFTSQQTFTTASATTAFTASKLYFTNSSSSNESLSGNFYVSGQSIFNTASATGLTSTSLYSTNFFPGFSNSFVSVDLNGKLIATTSPGGVTYTGTYPIIVSGSVISSGFSTSTVNVFSAKQTFDVASATGITSTNLYSTSFYPGFSNSFVSVDLNGKLIATTSPGGTTYTGTYPVIVSGSVISSGFSTTTNNLFTGTTSLATTTFRSAVIDTTGSLGSSGQVLSSTGTSTKWITSAGGGEVTYAYGSTTYQRVNQEIYNQSYGNQAGFSTDTYVGGSTTTVPQQGLQKGTRYYVIMYVAKTNASTAISTTTVRFGTNGTTADTARCNLPAKPQTAVGDYGTIEVWVTFNSVGSGSSAVIACSMRFTHEKSITGFGTLVSMATTTTSAGFDSTPANSIIGVSLNGGASASWTVSTVQARLENLP